MFKQRLLFIFLAVTLLFTLALSPALATEYPPEPPPTFPAPGAIVTHQGLAGRVDVEYDRAPWRLYDDGTFVVDAGFIHWVFADFYAFHNSPWDGINILNPNIDKIIITGPIAGGSFPRLFDTFPFAASIEGLHYIDTSNAICLRSMFDNTPRLTSLDLSGWETSRVQYMCWMFADVLQLESLNLSGWDTRSVTSMEGMFHGASSLRQLTLGENFHFLPHAALPSVPNNEHYTGFWQNVGTGTVEYPRGSFVLTSEQLMEQYNGGEMADTWVWQPRLPIPADPRLTIGEPIPASVLDPSELTPPANVLAADRHWAFHTFSHWAVEVDGEQVVIDEETILTADMLDEDLQLHLIPHWQQTLFGDVNGDGEVNTASATAILLHILRLDVDICLHAADVDQDGQIRMMDLALVQAFLLDAPVTLGGR